MNEKKRKILAPTDLSELSKAGVRHALEMAAATKAEVIVYNVVGYYESAPYYDLDGSIPVEEAPMIQQFAEDRRKLLAKFLRENFGELIAKVRVRQVVEVGTPYQDIVDKAAAEKVEMIVMSTHGRTGLLHALIGSVTEKVVRLADCPVLTVRPKIQQAPKRAAA